MQKESYLDNEDGRSKSSDWSGKPFLQVFVSRCHLCEKNYEVSRKLRILECIYCIFVLSDTIMQLCIIHCN